MSFYPIAIDLTGKYVLVVGGGSVATGKIEALLDYGAHVKVVSPHVSDEIAEMAEKGRLTVVPREYKTGDISGSTIVIAATDVRSVNIRVSDDARAAGIPVNVVDDPELCSFISQSVVKRGDLTISIGTCGKSPALSKQVRKAIEKTIGPEYGELAELLGEMRELARTRIESQPEREKAFKRMLDSEILELIRSGKSEDARKLALEILDGR